MKITKTSQNIVKTNERVYLSRRFHIIWQLNANVTPQISIKAKKLIATKRLSPTTIKI
jgi:hypothetical protein